jgi:hypothetical protein
MIKIIKKYQCEECNEEFNDAVKAVNHDCGK